LEDEYMHTRIAILWLVLALYGFSALSSDARDLFVADIVVEDEVVFRGTDKIFKVVDFFDNKSLSGFFPNYTKNSAVSARLDLRGLGVHIEYPGNSSSLIFRVPGSKFVIVFDGATRDESQEQFEDWLKGNYQSLSASDAKLTTLLQLLIKFSPVDPVAGNPNSLQTRMFMSDFDAGITGPFISSSGRIEGIRNQFTFGAEYGFFDAGAFGGQVVSVPINYKWNLKSVPKLSIIFDLPVTFTRTENAWSYMASFGTGVQFRPTSWWSLTPMVRAGGVGSFDVGALAVLVSGSLTNYFHYKIGSTHLGFGTLGGVSTSIDGIKIKGYDLSYELTNYVLRNGADLTQKLDFNVLGNPAAFKLFFNFTQFWGNDLYLDSFYDMGLGIATVKKIADSYVNALDLSFSYASGVTNDYDYYGFKLTCRF